MKQEKYEYKIVAPVNIVKAHKGVLNLGDRPLGESQLKAVRRLENSRAIEAYLSRVGIDGWELVATIDYEGLAYGGGLVLRKKYYVEDDEPEESTINADYNKNLDEGNLYQQYEQETKKHAIWHDKETKGYRDWKANRDPRNEKEEIPKEK